MLCYIALVLTAPLKRALAPTAARRLVPLMPTLVAERAVNSKPGFEAGKAPGPVKLEGEGVRHAVAPERIVAMLASARASLEKLGEAPSTRAELVERYVALGTAQSQAEASLVASLDALDALTEPGAPSPYRALREQAFALLSQVGAQYARLDTSWSKLVHGNGGWAAQPVVLAADRGDGVPRRAYINTFRSPVPLTFEQRKAEYEKRLAAYTEKSGSFDALIIGKPGVFTSLEPMFRYDYVVEEGGPMRLFPNGDDDDSVGPPKPGHSLLLEGGPEFRDVRATVAGELWVLHDARGELEAVVLANNSGHLKPAYEDLKNVVPLVESLGVPPEKVVLFGGPNNLPAMFRELEEKFPTEFTGLAARLPSMGAALTELRANPGPTERELWR